MPIINKITNWLFYALLFLLPLQTRLFIRPGIINGAYLEYQTISLYLTDIIAVAILSLWIFSYLLPKKEPWLKIKLGTEDKRLGIYLLAALEILAFISIYFAPYKLLGLYHYALLLLGLGLFFVVYRLDFSKLTAVYWFLAGAFLQSILAISQFVTQRTWANKFFGLAFHDSTMGGVSVIEFYDQQGILWRWLRSYGGLDHPNILGGFLALAFILTFYLIINRSQINFARHKQRLMMMLNYGLLLFIGLGLFFSFSRSAWLAALLGVLIIFLVKDRRLIFRKFEWRYLESKLIVIVGLIFLLVFALCSTFIETRFNFYNRLEKISSSERINSWPDVVALVKDSPLVGQGIGNYATALYERTPYYPAYLYQPVHNFFLLILAELGFIGFIIFLAFWIWLLITIIKNLKKNYLGLAIFVALTIIMMLDHWLFSLHFGIMLLWLAAGLIIKNENGHN